MRSSSQKASAKETILAAPGCAVRPVSARPRYRVDVLSSAKELDSYAAILDDLASCASVPNVFYDRCLLGPALAQFSRRNKERILLVWDSDDPRMAVGLFPLRIKRFFGSPYSIAQLWRHIHCFDTTPLVRKGYEAPVLSAVTCWAQENGVLAIHGDRIAASGTASLPLAGALKRLGLDFHIQRRFSRAYLRSGLSGQAYIAQAIRKKKRKELNRQRNRLSDLGDVTEVISRSRDDLMSDMRAFLDLERDGWKGRLGTALACSETESRFFLEAVERCGEQDKARIYSLTQDARAVGMLICFRSGEGLFTLKIAYDERLSRFSPGVLTELYATRDILDDPDIVWADSCAQPDHPMIEHLWRDAREISHIAFGTGHPLSGAALLLLRIMVPVHRIARLAGKHIRRKYREYGGNGDLCRN